MRGGKLDRLAQRLAWASSSRDALNQPVVTYTPTTPKFAVQQISQRPIEAWKAGQTAAQLETAFRARWSPVAAAVTVKDRLLVDGQTYEVIGTSEPDRRVELVFACVSIPNPEG